MTFVKRTSYTEVELENGVRFSVRDYEKVDVNTLSVLIRPRITGAHSAKNLDLPLIEAARIAREVSEALLLI